MGNIISYFEEWYYQKYEREKFLQELLGQYRAEVQPEIVEMQTVEDETTYTYLGDLR